MTINIEALAREAGLHMTVVVDAHPPPYYPLDRDLREPLARFAALVAEQCAQINEGLMREAEREAGPVAAGMLDKGCDSIRAAFPMPCGEPAYKHLEAGTLDVSGATAGPAFPMPKG